MRHLIVSIVSLVTILCALGSCHKPEAAVIGLKTESELQATSLGGELDVAFSVNGGWTASSSADWCAVSPASGSAGENVSVKINCGANDGTDSRKCDVVIKSGEATKIVVITQNAKAYFSADLLDYSVSCKSQKLDIEFQTNVDYDILTENCSGWISVSNPRTTPRGKVTLTIEENRTSGQRVGTLTIIPVEGTPEPGDSGITINVLQDAKFHFIVEEANLTYSCCPELAKVRFYTVNDEYDVSAENVDWAILTNTQAALQLYESSYILTPNSSPESRSFKITATARNYPYDSAQITITQRGTEEVVDLGLSVNWRAFNVGSTSIEGSGGFYAWGETEEKSYYSWETYKWAADGHGYLTKYCTDPANGDADGKTRLEPEDDAAHVILGDGWRTPTQEDFSELFEKCERVSCFLSGLDGVAFYSKVPGYEDKAIFIPASGVKSLGDDSCFRSMSWTADLYHEATPDWLAAIDKYAIYFHGSLNTHLRYEGLAIRPVKDK